MSKRAIPMRAGVRIAPGRAVVRIREFELQAQEESIEPMPGAAPSGEEIALAALGACFLTSFVYAAAAVRADLLDASVEVEWGDPATPAVLALHVRRASSASSQEQRIQRALLLASSVCTLTHTLRVPPSIRLTVE